MHLLKKALIFSAFFYVPRIYVPRIYMPGFYIPGFYVAIFYAAFFSAHTASHAAGHAYAANRASECPPQHIDESVRVNYVYDGDTLQLEDGRKVRLMGIDTPEIFSRHGRIAEDIKHSGEQAKATLKQLLSHSNQHVGLAFGPQRFDRYQRTLAHVYLPNGKNLQAALISEGRAIAFTTPPNDRMSDCYQQQEALAIKQKRGIWRLPRYQIKRTGQLTKSSDGFHRLRGKVTRIWQGNFRLTLFLDNRVEVKIRRFDLPNFNAHMLNSLENKNIEIRGWLHLKQSTQTEQTSPVFIMSLRHPDAIKVLN